MIHSEDYHNYSVDGHVLKISSKHQNRGEMNATSLCYGWAEL